MQTVKFRAFFPSENVMRDWDYLSSIRPDTYFLRSDIILMQFTGMKDKEGTEIYEKDIIGGAPHGTVWVEFDDEKAVFIACWEDIYEDEDSGEMISVKRRELLCNHLDDCGEQQSVIGNILQNPELIK